MGIEFGKIITRHQVDEDTAKITTEGYYSGAINTLEIEHELQKKTSKTTLLSDLLDCITLGKDAPELSISVKRGRDGQPAMIVTRYRVEKKHYDVKHMV